MDPKHRWSHSLSGRHSYPPPSPFVHDEPVPRSAPAAVFRRVTSPLTKNSFEDRHSFIHDNNYPTQQSPPPPPPLEEEDYLPIGYSLQLHTEPAVGFQTRIYRNIKVDKQAVFPLTVTALAGALRQMIVPVALMFTSATNAGIIQPSVPVFTAFLAIFFSLESGCIYTFISIFLAVIGLIIAGQAWNFQNIDKGFMLLLLVPLSKGLQVIGLQYASRYERSSVLQIYQIVGLIAFIVPVATILELALYSNWSFTIFWGFVKELDAWSWGALVYSAVSIILVCWRIQILGVQVIGSIGVALYQAFQPVFAFLLGHFVLGEPLLPIQIFGAAVVCVALIVYQYGQLKQRHWKRAGEPDEHLILIPGNPQLQETLLEKPLCEKENDFKTR